MSYFGNRDYKLDVSMGSVPGVSSVNKFGTISEAIEDTSNDIWSGGKPYVFPTTAVITSVKQELNQVSMLGGLIEVQGLDANWDLVTQTVTLDATSTRTAVTLTTPLIRVFRARVLMDVVIDSNIIITDSSDSNIYAVIDSGKNQTLMAIYTVPNGYTAYLTRFYSSVVEATGKEPKSTRFGLWAADRENGYEFQIKNAVGVPQSGSMIEQCFNPYLKFGEKTDIKLTCLPIDEPADVAAGFDLYLVAN